MADIIEIFSSKVLRIGSPETYSEAMCGKENCCLQAAMHPILKDTSSPKRTQFLNDLAVLDEWFSPTNHHRSTDNGDESIPNRWGALSATLQLLFDKTNRTLRDAAVARYNLLWLRTEANADPQQGALPRVPENLITSVPTTPGSLIVDDILNQINEVDKPVFIEKTPVLFGGSGGLVLYLVVEALHGPSGWVTPNHCLLGLIPFPCPPGHPDRHVPAAIQRVMRLAMDNVPLRLRWHLEGFSWNVLVDPNETNVNARTCEWTFPLVGRSVEAAAACAALAIVERYRDSQKPLLDLADKAVRRVHPILDDKVAVTGSVAFGRQSIADSLVEPVDHETLKDKLAAAAAGNIDTVCVAEKQSLEGVAIPEKLRPPKKVKTVHDAYQTLDNNQDILDRYREHVRSKFEMQWDEQSTPVTP